MKPETWSESPIHDMIRDAGLDKSEGAAKRPTDGAVCPRCHRLATALQAADECLAMIEDVGHGAHMDGVTVTRGVIMKAMSLDRVCCESLSHNAACGSNSGGNDPQESAPCPHCGSLKDPWFSRVLPMGYHCHDCGKPVDAVDDYNARDHESFYP